MVVPLDAGQSDVEVLYDSSIKPEDVILIGYGFPPVQTYWFYSTFTHYDYSLFDKPIRSYSSEKYTSPGDYLIGVYCGQAVLSTVGVIRATINDVDITENAINCTLEGPSWARGTLTFHARIGDNFSPAFQTYSNIGPGVHNLEFDSRPTQLADYGNLPEGLWNAIEARWHVNNSANGTLVADATTSHMHEYNIRNLGNYLHSQYVTPYSACFGYPHSNFCYNPGGDCHLIYDCTWTVDAASSEWLFDIDDNSGSGYHEVLGIVSVESHCPPQGDCLSSYYLLRPVPTPCPSCQGMNVIENETVAIMREHPHLDCDDTVYVHTVGLRTVTDTGGLVAERQLDHYAGINYSCDSIGNISSGLVTIKLID